MLRNVLSTVTTADVTPDYAAAVEELLPEASRFPERETYDLDEIGQKAYQTALLTFTCPETGQTRWAVYDEDPATRELEDTSERAEAEARYEELVRARAADMGYDNDGEPETFTVSDVEGVPVKE